MGLIDRVALQNYIDEMAEVSVKEIRAKAIDEVMEIVKNAYHDFCGYDLEFMTKYGNKNTSQQAESYSTLMMYEIAGEFDDLINSLELLKGNEFFNFDSPIVRIDEKSYNKAIDECIKIIEETAWKDTDMLVESIRELKGGAE